MFHFKNLSPTYPTVAEINLTHFKNNITAIKNQLDDVLFLAVIKTNAYGHGVVEIGCAAVEAGVDRLGTTSVEEGILLREKGVKIPIQLLSVITKEQIEDIVTYGLIASVSTEAFVRKLSDEAIRQNKVVPVHLKIDIGLHRFGIQPSEAIEFCGKVYNLPGLKWEGIYTHFSCADSGKWETTERQFALFQQTVKELEDKKIYFPIHHVGGSTISIERPDMYLDMVRPGISLFGYPPLARQEEKVELKRVMNLSTKILQVRELPPNTSIGYGGTYITSATEKLAVIPIGHGDGYQRALSNVGEVIVRGKRAKIVGIVSLDQTIIDVTHIPDVVEEDQVILIGEENDTAITAKEISLWMDSIVDEVLSSLMERIPRKYI